MGGDRLRGVAGGGEEGLGTDEAGVPGWNLCGVREYKMMGVGSFIVYTF